MDISNYVTNLNANNTYFKIMDISGYLTKSLAATLYQPANTYVLQSYLDANYNTTSYINNNYCNLNTANTLTGSLTLNGAVSFRQNTSILNSKIFSITSGSTFNSDSGSTANFNGTTNINGSLTVAGTTNFTTVPTINSVNIATLNNIPSTSLIYAPSFRSNSQSAGGVICGFQSQNGDSRFVMYDEGLGLTPNCAVIQTLAGNGIGIQAVYGTINNFIGTSLISQVASTGLSVTGNLSFTGTLNSMTTSIFSAINTAFGKQNSANTLISTSSTLSSPFASIYTLTNGSNVTITLPDATASNAGVNLLFRRTVAVTTTITFTTSGGQNIYNSTNSAATSPVLLPASTYILRLSSMTINGSTYAWFQV
jgi:hypothetical protein